MRDEHRCAHRSRSPRRVYGDIRVGCREPRESPVGTKWQSDQRWKLRWVETRNEIPDVINIAGMG